MCDLIYRESAIEAIREYVDDKADAVGTCSENIIIEMSEIEDVLNKVPNAVDEWTITGTERVKRSDVIGKETRKQGDQTLSALPSVETTAQYDDFHEEIKRLTKELEHYQSRCELLKSINDTQVETIRTYAAIVNILEKELKELKGELT